MESGCIIKHFESYAPISRSEADLLASLEKNPKEYGKNSNVWCQGDTPGDFYSLKRGWAYSFRDLEDGTRQVLDIYVPGNVIGLRDYAFRSRVSGLRMLTDGVLCAFPRSRLTEVFAESLLLCNIFFTIGSRDQAILIERLVNMGRRSAREKVAHFLVETVYRVDRTVTQPNQPLHLPLTQSLIADALGLSAVHVNRVFQELKDEGLVSSPNSGVQLLELNRLKEIARFDPTYLEEDIQAAMGEAGQFRQL
ncbi:Crp/Fnr family transcriptional regulator [Marinobacter nauticus]|uniref:Crp/Fnr family transcriptional regulator n=1 Tax=Marinobacter nauticus TaxID=2743 RepID=UPI0037360BDA